MKTTLILDEEVHRQAKQFSARLGIPLTRFIEEAVRLRIGTESARRSEPVRKLPVSRKRGGLRPGIDLDNSAELFDLLDQAIDIRSPIFLPSLSFVSSASLWCNSLCALSGEGAKTIHFEP